MKIKTHTLSDGNPGHEVITAVDITLDNGEMYRLSEVRTSASGCDLRVASHQGGLVLKPINNSVVQIGRRQ